MRHPIIFREVVYWFIMAFLVFCLWKSCTNTGSLGTAVIQTTKVIDTLRGEKVLIKIPQPYEVQIVQHLRDTIYDTINKTITIALNVDSIKDDAIRDMQNKLADAEVPIFHYDSIYTLSKGFTFHIKDTVQGLILGRSFSWNLFRSYDSTTTTTTIPQKKAGKLYIGLEYTYPINYLGGALLYQFRNDNILKAGVGYQNKTRQYNLGYFQKIKLK